MHVYHRIRTLFLLVAGAGLVHACGVIPSSTQQGIRIISTPSGAEVFASGKSIGHTPLSIVPDKVFAPRWVKTTYRAAGVLTLHKPGCERFSVQVDDHILSKDIIAELTCTYAQTQMQPPAPTPLTERLLQLEDLHQRGLISEEEYQSLRGAILKEL